MIIPKPFAFISIVFLGLNYIHAKVEFVRDVKPILEHNCVSCHREGNDKGNVRRHEEVAFESDDLIIAGNPDDGFLYWTTTLPEDDELFMPPIKNKEKDYPLTVFEKKILHDWTKKAVWPMVLN